MLLKPYWHGRMTDRGTIFWCENVDGQAVCQKEQTFWAMSYSDIVEVTPHVLGTIKENSKRIGCDGVYKDGKRILVHGAG